MNDDPTMTMLYVIGYMAVGAIGFCLLVAVVAVCFAFYDWRMGESLVPVVVPVLTKGA